MTYPKDFEVREISAPETGGMEGAARTSAQSTSENDLLAYLRRRRENALTIVRTNPAGSELHELATDRAQQCQVIIDDVTGGLHHGAAQIEAEMAEAEAARLAADAELTGTSQACRHGAEGDISTGASIRAQRDDRKGGNHGVF